MRRIVLTAVLLALTASALQTAPAQGSVRPDALELVDVPPCSYAAEAVRRLARLGIIQGYPATPTALAQNAVRQVFEGLRCGDAAWTNRFLSGVPQGYSTGIVPLGMPLRPGFEFVPTATRVTGDTATVSYRLRFVENGAVAERDGTARLARTDASGWLVDFESLAESGLPFFHAAN